MKQNCFFRSLLFLAVPLSLFFSAFSLTAQTGNPVLSPAEGVWANYQSLVLDLPDGTEAFYSLNGEDPAVSGFAYDGPVVLNVSGNARLLLVIIGSGGTQRFEIPYTVVLKETPLYMQTAFEKAGENVVFAEVNASSYIDIPAHISYTFGNTFAQTGKILSGRRLAFREQTVFERFIPLVIYDGDVPFRYMLHTGGDGGMPGIISDAEIDTTAPVEFIDWNYARFAIDAPLVYSIDEGAPRVSESGTIRIDRSEAHSIRWKAGVSSGGNGLSSGGFRTFSIPARPELKGVPLRAVVNTAVRLSFSDKDFLFCVTAKDGRKLFSPVFTVDILEGDAFGFSQNIDVYYKGIKQGSVRPSFIIDKIPPAPPAFISSESGFYARDSVQVSLTSDADIYYYAAPVIKSQTGFTAVDIQKINEEAPDVNDEDFVRLAGKNPYLKAGEKEALLYTLYAYSLDTAGNRSAVVRFQTVVDTVNYYAASPAVCESDLKSDSVPGPAGDGSPDKPFKDFQSLYAAVQKSPSAIVRCFVSGSFTGLHSLEITRDTEIIGDGNTRLVFEKGASLKVKDAVFSLKDSSLEQLYGGPSDIFQNRLIEAENARLVFSGAELICKDPNSAVCVSAVNSSVNGENSGISVEAPVYAEALNLRSAAAELKNLRAVVISSTALGLKSSRSSAVIDNSSFRLLGNLVRALEFTDSGFMLSANRFIAENPVACFPNKKMLSAKNFSSAAVWSNTAVSESAVSVFENNAPSTQTNTYTGFTSLYGGKAGGRADGKTGALTADGTSTGGLQSGGF
ncbi:hypothetical protein [Treponema sp.]|uniref:hypothetical protein n=1 Tax=Treponema sp. TaxID=166 RepID=UPI003FA333E3